MNEMTTPTDTEKLAQALREMIDYYRGDRTEEPYVMGRARAALAAHERAQPAPDWPDGPDREPPAQPASAVAGWVMMPRELIEHMVKLHDERGCVLTVDMDRLKRQFAATPQPPAKENGK